MPIKIYAIEVYAISKKEFNYREKIKKLEKIALSSGQPSNPLTFASVFNSP